MFQCDFFPKAQDSWLAFNLWSIMMSRSIFDITAVYPTICSCAAFCCWLSLTPNLIYLPKSNSSFLPLFNGILFSDHFSSFSRFFFLSFNFEWWSVANCSENGFLVSPDSLDLLLIWVSSPLCDSQLAELWLQCWDSFA